jgi:hypothetical protein
MSDLALAIRQKRDRWRDDESRQETSLCFSPAIRSSRVSIGPLIAGCCQASFCPPPARRERGWRGDRRVVSGLDDIAVMGQTIEQCGRHLCVSEDSRPFAEGKVGCDDGGAPHVFLRCAAVGDDRFTLTAIRAAGVHHNSCSHYDLQLLRLISESCE